MDDGRKLSDLGNKNKISGGDRIGSPGNRVLRRDFDLNVAALLSDSEDKSDDSNVVRKELRKSRRFDPVYNSQWVFTEQFEDKNVGSNCEEEDDDYPNGNRVDEEGNEFEDEDEGRNARMLDEISNSRKRKCVSITEVEDNRVVEAQEKDDARLLEPSQPLKSKKPRHPGKGRRKIEIKRLEDKSKRMVTFVKRRDGLFSKMQALCTACGIQGAALTFSEAQNVYVFGNPTFDTVVDRYLIETSAAETTADECHINEPAAKEIQDKYAEALARLEKEKKCGQVLDKVLGVAEGSEPTEALGSDEVELIQAMMEEMMNKPSSSGLKASNK